MSHASIIPDPPGGSTTGWTVADGVLTAEGFFTPPGLFWGFTTREAGDFKNSGTGLLLAARYGVKRLKLLNQVHGTGIVESAAEEPLPEGDGWLGLPDEGALLGIKAADCLPVLFWSADGLTAGAVHAGWRGAVAGIARRFVDLSGADPASLYAVFGPAIGACCYEVGMDVAERAGQDARWLQSTGPGKFHFDLKAYVKAELEASGMKPGNMLDCGMCTMCRRDLFHSHRAEPGGGRSVAFLGFSR